MRSGVVVACVVAVALLLLASAGECSQAVPAASQPLQPVGALHRFASASQRATAQANKRVASATSFGKLYHSTNELYAEITSLAATCKHLSLEWRRAPSSVDRGRKVSLMAVRINYDAETYPDKQERALLLFGEHARELISPETALAFLRTACNDDLMHTRLKNVNTPLIEILKRTEFLLFPNSNPSGRRITEKGDYCNRVNERKVDLNRNWGEHWSGASDHPDTYPGPQAWSEAETVILAHAAAEWKPTIFISIHSGSLHMLSPFAFKSSLAGEPAASTTAVDPPGMPHSGVLADDVQEGTGLKPVLRVLRTVNKDFCRCAVGAAGGLLGYLSPGTCLDYVYNRIGTRYAFALEIYSGRRYANKRAPRASVLLEEDMHADRMSFPDEQEHEEAASESDLSDAEQDALAEVNSEFFSHAHGQTLNSLPSFSLPSFTEMASETRTDTDAQCEEPPRSRLFPRARRGRARRCLLAFNPTSSDMYARTTDHWSRGLFALVDNIGTTRPRAVVGDSD